MFVEGAWMPAYSCKILMARGVFQFWWFWEAPCRGYTKGYVRSL